MCDDIMYRPKCDEQEAVLVLHALGILAVACSMEKQEKPVCSKMFTISQLCHTHVQGPCIDSRWQ